MSDPDADKRRRERSLAIAGVIALFVLIVYLVTILKIGGQIAERPM